MTEEERKIQIALGTLTEYGVWFAFGDLPRYNQGRVIPRISRQTYMKTCIYTTIIFATNEKEAIMIAYVEMIQKKKWQKGYNGFYRVSNNSHIIEEIKRNLQNND